MASRGQTLTLTYVAWNTSTGAGQTGDVANHTLRWVKDGTSAAPTNAATEVDATNAPGVYKLTLTGTECTADVGVLCGKSSTSNVSIIPLAVTFEQLPTAAAGANGGLPTVDASNRITGIQGTINNLNNLDAAVSTRLAAASYTAPDNATIATILADTDNIQTRLPATLVGGRMDSNAQVVADKSGYALSQAFPTNFASLSITAAGLVDITQTAADKVWSTAARTLTGFGTLVTDIWASVTRSLTDKAGFELSSAGVDAILDDVVEGTLTMRQMIRIMMAALAGKSSGGGTATILFKGADGTTTRITATVDADGNRTAITVNGA